jgi:hypothetical protein
MSYLSKVNIDSLKNVTVVPVGNQLAFQNPDGSYVSIQPDGNEQVRVVGKDGWTGPASYELATPLGNGLVMFTPDGSTSYIRKYVP